jgi:hypothetical protein
MNGLEQIAEGSYNVYMLTMNYLNTIWITKFKHDDLFFS